MMYWINAAIAVAVMTMPVWLLLAWAAIQGHVLRHNVRVRRQQTGEQVAQ